MKHYHLMRFLKSKFGLGTAVGNLIVLAAAVILTTVVVVFATNMTTSQVQKEKLYIATSHVWYVDPEISIAAIAISNTGPTDIVLSKLDVKGLTCQWNGTDNFVIYCKFNGTLPGDLPLMTSLDNTVNTTITIADQPYEFTVASEGLTIKAGSTIGFYAVIPERIMVYDLATPLRMVISTTQSVYCTETLVQTA